MIRILAVIVLVLLHSAAHAQPSEAESRASGRALGAAFYAKDFDKVWAAMNEPAHAALKSPQFLPDFHAKVTSQLGVETAVIEESVKQVNGLTQYQRRARFDKTAAPVLVTWLFDNAGKLAAFSIMPEPAQAAQAAPSAYLDYQTRTTLRLPFGDEFFVFWGGRSVAENYHAAHASQRFAYDLLILREGTTHSGDGNRNEDYYCFGRPLLAPAAGQVVTAFEGVDDNVPGQMNTRQIVGNHLIIDHGNGEFSMLAHLRRGSVRVKAGERVAAGQQVGECGNSGNSSEAHLHYQLQAGPVFGVAAALPAQFSGYQADGKAVARGEPVRGQRIRQDGGN
ncbi:MAG: M23 family metallopeptidase [Massilia sp.]